GFPRAFLEAHSGAHLVIVNSSGEGLNRLKAGTIDALAADLWVVSYLIERGKVRGVTVVGGPFATAQGAIAVRKGNVLLLDELNRAIGTLEAEGTIARIQNDWRPQEMLFASRERVRGLITLVAVGLFLILLAGMGLWILTLKRQVQIRHKAEDQLQTLTERLRLANATAAIGVWDWDLRTNEVIWDDRSFEIYGLPPDPKGRITYQL